MNDGKKKKDDVKTEAAESQDAAAPTRAEIEGVVELEPESEPTEFTGFDDADPEVGDASSVETEAAEAGEAPKKVRRVVKKKVTSEEA